MKEIFFLIFTLLCLSTHNSYAQTTNVRSISEKPRKEYTGNILSKGTYDLDMALNLYYTENNNIYATRRDSKSDSIYIIKPEIDWTSNWIRHKTYARANGQLGVYDEYTNENYQDYSLNTGGRIDIVRDTSLSLDIKHNRLHEDRGSTEDVNGIEPTTYYITSLDTNFDYGTINRFKTKLQLHSDIYEYEHNYGRESSTNQKFLIHNRHRNRTENKALIRFNYEFKPPYSLFVEGNYNERDYETSTQVTSSGNTYVVKDSKGYDIKTGGEINLTGKIDAELYGAYLKQDYENDNFEDIREYYGGGSLLWNFNNITSLELGIDREIIETRISNASSYISDQYYAELEHELRRHLLVFLKYTEKNNNYQFKNDANYLEDDIMTFETKIRYYIHRFIHLDVGYNYKEKNSNEYDNNYIEEIFFLTFNYKI
ncbi:outer membrane beta-barrel protein [Pseudomonadota bacterium]